MSTFVIHPTDEQAKVVTAFLEALNISFVMNDNTNELPEHVLKGIQKSREDIKAGRTMTYEEFKSRKKAV
ncbi:DUF2683 family protein [Mucilaginibacter sp. AK015]|uniref:DUF2683 family protein n=1 Tax=Mucilaginibacter sp. AK015 TaxID=2723072 RepID=UPI001610609D|nr:DUF2683 family protein [Mucilaginibacter sp. AK015]MBB5396193.1 hypothetical protein [Mucilaginibacter sp. AK015]